MLRRFATQDEARIEVEEVEFGFGFEAYPLELVQLADSILEMSGTLPDQDEILRYDPAWLRDISRYRRWKAATRKVNGV